MNSGSVFSGAGLLDCERGMSAGHATPQSMQALEVANRVRAERTALKRRLRVCAATLAEAIVAPCMARATIETLPMALHRVGAARLRLLLRAKVTPTRLVCELTDRERAALVSAVEAWRDQRP